jgi:serine protease Do
MFNALEKIVFCAIQYWRINTMNIHNEDILMLQTIERYLDGSMLPDEQAYFEQLRKNTPEIDQMVVEHSMFLSQMDEYVLQRNFKHSLHNVHAKLLATGEINEGGVVTTKGKVVQLYNRYKKDLLVAASVGGAIAILVSCIALYLSPTVNGGQLELLGHKMAQMERNVMVQGIILDNVKDKLPENVKVVSGGTGFLIDAKGYIATNAHVLKGSDAIVVNSNGDEFKASIIHVDKQSDFALLKIEDEDYQPLKSLPYAIGKSSADLGEEIFTLGYPRDDNSITYTQGYLSALRGFKGDTASYQIQMNSNPGNSGGPVLNKNGEVIGILSSRQVQADGVTFVIKSKNIYQLVDELKKTDTSVVKIKMPTSSNLRGKEREMQVKKIQDCVFSIKAYNK